MLKKERQIYILEKVKREGRAITNDLVEELGVAEDTIRKDFQELSKKGLVRRIHGGVLRMENNEPDNQTAACHESYGVDQRKKCRLHRWRNHKFKICGISAKGSYRHHHHKLSGDCTCPL